MDFRKKPDSADTAYREAVARLRILLTESYVPIKRFYPPRSAELLDSPGDETDNQSLLSTTSRLSRMIPHLSYPQRRYGYSPRSQLAKTYNNMVPTEQERNIQYVLLNSYKERRLWQE